MVPTILQRIPPLHRLQQKTASWPLLEAVAPWTEKDTTYVWWGGICQACGKGEYGCGCGGSVSYSQVQTVRGR